MSVKIRLARRGRRKKPYYHIVVADSRSPRDGRFIEQIGSYNPMTVPATIELDVDKAYEWLTNGAQPTYTAKAILRYKGVLYKKHLQRGVAKGALTQEEADQKLKDWLEVKEAKVADAVEQTRKEREEFLKMVSGEIKVSKKSTADDETKEAFREDGDEPAAEAEATDVAEETPVAEMQDEVAEEAAPAAEPAAGADAAGWLSSIEELLDRAGHTLNEYRSVGGTGFFRSIPVSILILFLCFLIFNKSISFGIIKEFYFSLIHFK